MRFFIAEDDENDRENDSGHQQHAGNGDKNELQRAEARFSVVLLVGRGEEVVVVVVVVVRVVNGAIMEMIFVVLA